MTSDGPETEFGLRYRASLHRAHDWLRTELDQLRALAAQVGAGEVGVREARATINALAVTGHRWDLGAFCEAYCGVLARHHVREDVEMFPAVLGVQPDLGPVVDRLDAEHRAVAAVARRLDDVLVRLSRSAPDGTRSLVAELIGIVDELTVLLRAHLAHEEEALHDALGRLPAPI
ncbi:hemerythrin domain-containing protein [Pseudonocardia endophytica]|uniref:Hemerythrin HHE cation binding domain-containing protein n=1 Tax=Pseudonocardia endophytica TaxID=401976 RepID=A0A4V2PHW2_PSEEN|nr:hemerythrin domain-containing protein [Pseudonocardia endophytica]TCK22076.1 hemerythrin HHE cation binding domain-containing protein [Pseudonocardia endophytica]